MRKAIRVLGEHFRTLSFREFLSFAVSAGFKSERILIYQADLCTDARERERAGGITVTKGERADLVAARERLARSPWEFQCDLYDGVRDFFIFKHEGGIGHITWLYYAGDPNRILRLGAQECEAKFVLTLPELRGRGLFPAALGAAMADLRAKGFRRLFVCVNEDNTSSRRAIEKAGLRQVGAVHLRKVFGVQTSRRVDTRSLAERRALHRD